MNRLVETVDCGSFTMDYVRFGSGSNKLVILPGLSVQRLGQYAHAVAGEYQLMKQDFTVYVFDRRNELPNAYSLPEMAEDTAKAICTLGLSDICLFGASQGGMMALLIALEHPSLVRKLALGCTSSSMDEKQYAVLFHWAELAREEKREELYVSFGEKLYSPSLFRQIEPLLKEMAKDVTDDELKRFVCLVKASKDFSVTDRLSELSCPVFAVGSRDDRVLGAEATLVIAKALREKTDFTLHLYDGYGHAAYDTAPDSRQRLYRWLTE